MKRCLVACEYSGTVRDAFIRHGWDAISCDLLPSDVGGPHHQGDVFEIIKDGFDLLVAHPPCTYLTSSAAWAFTDGPYHQNVKAGTLVGAARRAARQEALEFVTRLWKAPIKMKCLENPRGCINTRLPFMPKPQWIHPHQFGHDASKNTGLWLDNLPPLKPTKNIEPRWVCCGIPLDMETAGRHGCANCCGDNTPLPRWANQTDSGQNRLSPTEGRWKIRSETYDGIGEAMAAQWTAYIDALRVGSISAMPSQPQLI